MEPRTPSPALHNDDQDDDHNDPRVQPIKAHRSSWFAKTVAQNLAVQDFSIRVTGRRALLDIPNRTELHRRTDEVVGRIDAIVDDVADLAMRAAPNTRSSGLSVEGEQITLPNQSSSSTVGHGFEKHTDRSNVEADLQSDAAMIRLEQFRRAARMAQKRNVTPPTEPVLQNDFDEVDLRTQPQTPKAEPVKHSELWNAVFDNDDFAKRIKEAREVIANRQQQH